MPAGNQPKINLIELDRLTREGKSGVDLAKHFNVSRAAICQARKKLKVNIVRTVSMDRAAQVVDTHLDMMGQLRNINHTINQELDRAKQNIESAEPKDKCSMQQIIIRLSAEIRKQLSLYLSIAETWHDQKIMAEFQQELIDILKEVSPEVKDEFVKRIKQRQAIRGVVQFP